MAVSEQTDSLRVLGTDPVDYLVTPRVLSCMIAGPVLNVLCFTMGRASSPLPCASDSCDLIRLRAVDVVWSRWLRPGLRGRPVPGCAATVRKQFSGTFGKPMPPRHHARSAAPLAAAAGIAASVVLAQTVYDVPANVILESAARAVGTWDVVTSMIKAWVFGLIISVVRPHTWL